MAMAMAMAILITVVGYVCFVRFVLIFMTILVYIILLKVQYDNLLYDLVLNVIGRTILTRHVSKKKNHEVSKLLV